ncbi:MAG: (d)CMP kinase [Chitinophagaceae bacterium]
MNKRIIIAIDGYSACGKSTLAQQLAKCLKYIYIDSGAIYRVVTLYFLQNAVSYTDTREVSDALKNIFPEFRNNGSNGNSEMWFNGVNVEKRIREIDIAEKVSEVAAISEVRHFAEKCQREMSKNKGIVMDGRDIGTVVFPHAELKLFMTADMETRVQRRYEEMKQKKENVSLEEVRKNIEERDYMDTHRKISPLLQAKDAILIDNTHLTKEEQLDYTLALARKVIASL